MKRKENKDINNEFNEIQNNDKKRTINKVKIILCSIFLLAILSYVLYVVIALVKNPTDTFMVTNGEVSQEENVNGYIVRNETVVRGENYKNGMVKIKNEGERVAKGDSIFRYYSSGEENIKEEIAKIDEEIQSIMENQNGAFSSDIKLLESQIENELNLVYGINSVQEIQEYKKNIDSNITKKAVISGEQSPAGSALRNLIEQRTSYENQLENGSEYITATTSGIVSYRVDGLENVLTTENFGNFNKEFLENLNLKVGQTIASSEEMGKIIDNFSCYIIFNSDTQEAKSAEIDDSIQIRLPNSDVVKATISNIIEESDGSRTIALKIEKDVQELISYRKISLDIIWWSAEGYRIPNSAIKQVDGLDYVVRNRNGYYDKMLVKILRQNSEYCIVREYTTEELQELGFTNTEIYNMKNINLYDEIVINPTEEQLLQ